MTHVTLKKVRVDFPVFSGVRSFSLKKRVLATLTGGQIGSDARGYKTVSALRGIDIDLRPGDRLGVSGFNGSGKSTLLKVIAGVYVPTGGEMTTDGKVMPLLNIALGAELELTGAENITLRGRLLGYPTALISEKFQEIVQFSGLGDFIDLPMRTYSSGMILRLMFAISTTIPSDILVMDEWLSVGDSDFGAKADKRLMMLIERTPIVIIASHDQQLLARHCNRHIYLENGQQASPA